MVIVSWQITSRTMLVRFKVGKCSCAAHYLRTNGKNSVTSDTDSNQPIPKNASQDLQTHHDEQLLLKMLPGTASPLCFNLKLRYRFVIPANRWQMLTSFNGIHHCKAILHIYSLVSYIL